MKTQSGEKRCDGRWMGSDHTLGTVLVPHVSSSHLTRFQLLKFDITSHHFYKTSLKKSWAAFEELSLERFCWWLEHPLLTSLLFSPAYVAVGPLSSTKQDWMFPGSPSSQAPVTVYEKIQMNLQENSRINNSI